MDQEIFERLNEAPKLLKPFSLPEASWKSSRSRWPKLGPKVGSVLAVVVLWFTEKKRGDSRDGLDKLKRKPSCWFPMSAGNPSRTQSKKKQSSICCSRSILCLLTILIKAYFSNFISWSVGLRMCRELALTTRIGSLNFNTTALLRIKQKRIRLIYNGIKMSKYD